MPVFRNNRGKHCPSGVILMSQIPSQPEEKKSPESAQAASAPAPAKTGNLAFTNPDEYKHKHGEHKDGEHHHHHHHHHHRHFHLLSLSPSGIRDNLKLLFKTSYAYPYILLFLSLVILFVMDSGLVLSQFNAHKASFSDIETFYRWQEFLVMNNALMVRIPFQFTLLVSVGITLFLMQQQERHWQRNVLKLLPALGAAAIFSLPMGGDRAKSDEISKRRSCCDSLQNYRIACIRDAALHDDALPAELPEKLKTASKYESDHYVYHGRGKKAGDEPFILLEDKDMNHIGNVRYAIRNDGMILVSRYGGLYEEYKSPKQSAADQK